MKNTLIITASVIGLSAGSASAAVLEFSDSVSLSTTNWTDSLAVSQFDSALGTLTSVVVTLTGGVSGDAFGESLDAAPAEITLDLSAEITAATSALGEIGTVLPLASESFSATADDGTIDFGGTSGVSFTGLTGTDSDSSTLTGGDMAEFIGTGTVEIMLEALGMSIGSGAGNLITRFATQAEATVDVRYTYDEVAVAPVPLPAGAALMLTGLGALAVARRKTA